MIKTYWFRIAWFCFLLLLVYAQWMIIAITESMDTSLSHFFEEFFSRDVKFLGGKWWAWPMLVKFIIVYFPFVTTTLYWFISPGLGSLFCSLLAAFFLYGIPGLAASRLAFVGAIGDGGW